ncbi:MAG: hypothetical protein HYV14_14730 [Elusimicrobia bacterium]|nr:hypothetical protein [Elusimicrobiota bacterium]
MMKRALLAGLILAAAGCSRQAAQNYRRCLKLRVGMTREQVFAAMGQPEETFPYVEGKSLPHLKGRTAYEWSTPASMPAPNRVSFEDATGKAESIRCGDAVITAAVFIEPPAPPEPAVSTSVIYGVDPSAAPAAPKRAPREGGSSGGRASGKPLTE